MNLSYKDAQMRSGQNELAHNQKKNRNLFDSVRILVKYTYFDKQYNYNMIHDFQLQA